MIAFSEIYKTSASPLFFTAAILLVFFQIYLFLFSVRRKSGKLFSLLLFIRIIAGIILLSVLLDGKYKIEYLPYKRAFFDFETRLYDIPAVYYIILSALSLLISVLCAVYLHNIVSSHLSDYSVKNAFDYLPIGICVSNAYGTAVLSNLKMNEISNKLTGSVVKDGFELWDYVKNHSTEQNGQRIVHTADEAFVFEQSVLTINGQTYYQYIAEDQSKQYCAIRELDKKNSQLRDYQKRLKDFRIQEEELIIKQENLKARTTIHTQLGGVLLTGKYFLENPEKNDKNELLKMLWYINTYLLNEVDMPETDKDSFEEAVKMAERIGVTVLFEGVVPENEPYRSVLGQAIAECAANTVKHSDGDSVNVVIYDDDSTFRFTVTNNGTAPEKEIVESGGLLSLRQTVVQAGAEMELHSFPAFMLKISFKK